MLRAGDRRLALFLVPKSLNERGLLFIIGYSFGDVCYMTPKAHHLQFPPRKVVSPELAPGVHDTDEVSVILAVRVMGDGQQSRVISDVIALVQGTSPNLHPLFTLIAEIVFVDKGGKTGLIAIFNFRALFQR